ncbi:MAG TPA: hypothetical protein VK154_08630 [Chitinophagales bacterium]|nr:hypothetical protein [Chitinophagales bacterium]
MLKGKGIFRLNDWWMSKAAMLMGMVYIFTLWFGIPFPQFLNLALLSLATISGFASTGYLLNDFFDREKDFKAGKENFLLGKPAWLILLLFIVSISLLFLPWIKLPFDRFSLALIVAEVLLLLAYSLPPIRLKERGMAGIITDSLYAHTVPVVLACYTFSLAAGYGLVVLPVILLVVWQSAMGVRNILIHQADDMELDKLSGSKNWVQQLSPGYFYKCIWRIILVEVIGSLAFFSWLCYEQVSFWPVILVVCFLCLMALIRFKEAGIKQMLESRSRVFPNAVFEKWIPVAVLFVLGFSNFLFWLVLVLHVAVFSLQTYFKAAAQGNIYGAKLYWRLERIPFRAPFSFAVNYCIYCVFLLAGVNLKKENMSALDYLNRKKQDK